MRKIEYGKIRTLYKKLCFEDMQKKIKNIKSSDITYRFVTSSQEILELMEDVFDTPFWEYLISKSAIEESLLKKEMFILFEIYGMPCALALVSDVQHGNKRELYQLDVEDSLFLRGNGIGKKVVNILRDNIYPNEQLYGYAVSESIKFWSKQAKYYDREVFEDMKREHFENGGSEEELYYSEGLMYFEI